MVRVRYQAITEVKQLGAGSVHKWVTAGHTTEIVSGHILKRGASGGKKVKERENGKKGEKGENSRDM